LSDHATPPIVSRQATDTLMRAMQDFGESEPKWAIVIYLNENDELCWMRSDMSVTMAMGALELVKTAIQRDWLGSK